MHAGTVFQRFGRSEERSSIYARRRIKTKWASIISRASSSRSRLPESAAFSAVLVRSADFPCTGPRALAPAFRGKSSTCFLWMVLETSVPVTMVPKPFMVNT